MFPIVIVVVIIGTLMSGRQTPCVNHWSGQIKHLNSQWQYALSLCDGEVVVLG